MLAITGMTYHELIGTHYLQDINHDYLFQDVAVFNQRLMGPAHVANVVDLACRAALSKRAVSHIAIPIDIQVQEVSTERRSKRNIKGHTSRAFQVPKVIPERELLVAAAELFRGKKKPVILAGAGARCRRGAGAGGRAAGRTHREGAARQGVRARRQPLRHRRHRGGGHRPSQIAMKSCDAFLIVGSAMPYLEFLPDPGQAVAVQLDDNPDRIGLRYPVALGLVGDAQATLRELLTFLPRNDDRSFLEQAQQNVAEWWATFG